jgi:hypothetical protein
LAFGDVVSESRHLDAVVIVVIIIIVVVVIIIVVIVVIIIIVVVVIVIPGQNAIVVDSSVVRSLSLFVSRVI